MSSIHPGATYRFIVASAEEAVATIRERLGENARVLSVRQVNTGGLAGFFRKSQLEVIAQAAADEPEAPAPSPAAGALIEAGGVEAVAALPHRQVDESMAPAGSLARARAETDGLTAGAARMPDLLRRGGFSEALVGRLSATPAMQNLDQRPLHQALAELGQAMRRDLERRAIRPLPARTAFLGTPGVGRTTALCKWLSLDVFARKRAVRVIRAEFDRPNPAEGLAVFCEALGVPVDYVTPDLPLPEVAQDGLVYADLPALSLRDPAENRAIADFLQSEQFAGRVLVLNAAYDASLLRKGYAIGRDLGATHLVFTHLDEVDRWGKLWDLLIDGELQPLFLATGPSLSGDCDENVVDAVMRRTLPGA
ncbi:flagellar GTP-binding protein [Nibricoccus sp. IMCC34717]|uniref:flagellar biosynthesis protein FlhF n=1 Tax=Nibricoccus sp. IMCC34717 TaxID=3034021 RepID=UPI00384EF3CD